MKKFKSLPLLLFTLLTIAIFSTSCGEDRVVEENVEYVVDVQIVSPSNNASIAAGEAFTVEVDFARQENIIHNIKVEIMDMAGNPVRTLVERHAHVANEFTFISDPISMDQAGTYRIQASTTDLHLGEDENHPEDKDEGENNLVEHIITVQ